MAETESRSRTLSIRRLAGIALVVVSAVAFGALAIFGRYAYADGVDVFTMMFLRFSFAAAVMAALMAARRESLPPRPALIRLVGMGAIGYVGQAFSYLTALKYASAGLVALLFYLYPVFVAILSIIVLKERIARTKVMALGLALVGTALAVGPGGGRAVGILVAVAGAMIYAVYIIVGAKVMMQVTATQASPVIFASAGAVSGALMTLSGPHWPATAAGWTAIVLMALIATVLAVTAFLAGLERIGPTSAATISTLEPPVTVILAAWLLNETLPPLALLGGGLILGAALLLTHRECLCLARLRWRGRKCIPRKPQRLAWL